MTAEIDGQERIAGSRMSEAFCVGETDMGKRKGSAAGRLFDLFGTILLITILTVCVINFARDGRIFQKAPVSASVADAGKQQAEGRNGKSVTSPKNTVSSWR